MMQAFPFRVTVRLRDGGMSAGTTTLYAFAALGAQLPDPAESGAYYIAVHDGQLDACPEFEFVKVTARTGDVLTVVRGELGSSATAKLRTASKYFATFVGFDYQVVRSVAQGDATWGLIAGTLSAQTDLQGSLDAITALAKCETLTVAVSDESTELTTGTAKVTFRMPHAGVITAIRANINAVSSSGIVTVDVNEEGTSILSTKLTVDEGEKTSVTAAVPAVISDAAIADDAEMTIDIDVAGTGAKGLKVTLYYARG